MPALAENRTSLPLTIAKPTGLNDLGVPVVETSVVKKGRLQEFTQLLDDGKVGRRFQNLRATAIKTTEGGVESAKLVVQVEVFGDDNVPLNGNSGFSAALYDGEQRLIELVPGSMFLPYARFWHDNRFAFDLPLALFERADRLEFVARADQVRMI